MPGDQDQTPVSLTGIEKEGDAARVALARQLARQAFNNPSLMSRAKLGRLGDRGLPSFLDELGKIWSKAARSVGERSQSGSSANASNTADTATNPVDRTQKPVFVKNNERTAGGDRHPHAVEAVAKAPQPPRPPHNIEGWAHLRTWKLSPKAAGIGRGFIVGLVLVVLGVLFLIGAH